MFSLGPAILGDPRGIPTAVALAVTLAVTLVVTRITCSWYLLALASSNTSLVISARYRPLMWLSVFRNISRKRLCPQGLYLGMGCRNRLEIVHRRCVVEKKRWVSALIEMVEEHVQPISFTNSVVMNQRFDHTC